jgi:pyrroline-5-carboxylate reductase
MIFSELSPFFGRQLNQSGSRFNLSHDKAELLSAVHLSFIGCGTMAEAIIAGLLGQNLVSPSQMTGSHPRASRRQELQEKHGIRMLASNRDAATFNPSSPGNPTGASNPGDSIVVLAVKPQRLAHVMSELKGALGPKQLVLSIVAGARLETIATALLQPAVVRAMPNTPAQINKGITAWVPTVEVSSEQKDQVRALLSALGKEILVENERMVDMATALSATGPTYIFLVMEALVDAGVHMGFSRHVAEQLVQETMLGSVLFAMKSHKHPAELRNMVTSPGGTSAEAIYQMEKGGLRTVLSKAVWAAFQRAVALGQKQ